MIVDLLLRLVHILSGVLLLGGVFFTRFALNRKSLNHPEIAENVASRVATGQLSVDQLMPAMKEVSDETRDAIQDAVRSRWAKVVMATSLLLLVSGLINAVLMIKRYEFDGGTYHILVGVKLLLALAIMWLSAKLAGRSAAAKAFQRDANKWANINVILAIVLLVVANVMKLSDRMPKQEEANDTSATAAATEVVSNRG